MTPRLRCEPSTVAYPLPSLLGNVAKVGHERPNFECQSARTGSSEPRSTAPSEPVLREPRSSGIAVAGAANIRPPVTTSAAAFAVRANNIRVRCGHVAVPFSVVWGFVVCGDLEVTERCHRCR